MKQILKQTILAATIVLIAIAIKGQSIKDYFIPDSTYNMMSYNNLTPTGEKADMSGVIFYVKKGTTYDITKAQTIQGSIVFVQTMTIQFSAKEAIMIKSVSTTTDIETNKKTEYNPPRTIFKMPPTGQTISWAYTNLHGDNIKCKASWTTVTIDGKEKKAIKSVNQIEGLTANKIEYYVKGIGFWKSEMQGTESTFTFEKFNTLSYDPTAK